MCMKFRNLAKNKNSLKFKCTEPKSESAKKFEEKYGNVFTIVSDEHTFCRGEKTGDLFEMSILDQVFKNYIRID